MLLLFHSLTTSLGDNTNYCRVEPDVEIPPCSPFVSHIGDLLVSPKGKTSFPKRLLVIITVLSCNDYCCYDIKNGVK